VERTFLSEYWPLAFVMVPLPSLMVTFALASASPLSFVTFPVTSIVTVETDVFCANVLKAQKRGIPKHLSNFIAVVGLINEAG
jgi:hypothetical protein